MNYQSKTFAGQYKLGACFNFLGDLCVLVAAYLHPPTLGPGVLNFAFGVVLNGVLFCQAIVYSKPKIVAESDDD